MKSYVSHSRLHVIALVLIPHSEETCRDHEEILIEKSLQQNQAEYKRLSAIINWGLEDRKQAETVVLEFFFCFFLQGSTLN